MAKLPFRPTPFFANKNRAFWILQFAGWGAAMTLRALSALNSGQEWNYFLLIFITTITGFGISLVMAVIFRQLLSRALVVTFGVTAITVVVAVSTFAFIDSWVYTLRFADADINFTQRFLTFLYLDATLLGGWSALYYAINFQLQVEEQADRLQSLEMQATSAQLAMLRYQLNPHFLFNTLNSISTLVLLKHTEQANAMLTRLSSFLRHTLVNKQGGKVTLAEEIATLKLYLDIERMRFEERLRTDFRIDEGASKARLPSLLLQPLVENAIKYAVSQQEEGAQIRIAARLLGQRLQIMVADTGPGLPGAAVGGRIDPDALPASEKRNSTGVGLANIRDRLAQAYGEDHRFEIRAPADGGFTVVIELPLEIAEEQRAKGAALPDKVQEPASQPAPSPAPIDSPKLPGAMPGAASKASA